MSDPSLDARFTAQERYFHSGATQSKAARVAALRNFEAVLRRFEPKILAACAADLCRNDVEARASDVALPLEEVRRAQRKVGSWMRAKWSLPPLVSWPSIGAARFRPLGVNLIIAPWNYPFLLSLAPLVACVAAGNVAFVKPSELAVASAEVIAEIIREAFPPEHVTTVLGDATASQALLARPFDHVFFTGSARVGRAVAKAAADHLAKVTLELGGKSPVIVMPSADLDVASRRIILGKFFNTGQSCVAPDYLLVHSSIREVLIERIQSDLVRFFGPDPTHSADYGRIINDAHTERLIKLIDPTKVLCGGSYDRATRYIAPTLLGDVSREDPIMQEEIFGPLLPILSFDDRDEARAIIASNARPLALYLFTREKADKRFFLEVPFGGGCINSTLLHFADANLPFGGIGSSGYGVSHGYHGFQTFSHHQGVLEAGTFVDIPLRYPPYTARKKTWIRRIMG